MMVTPGVVLLGLGPGDPNLLTRQAWALLEGCSEVYLRTRQHPVVGALPARLQLHSFDDLYENGETFEAVYEQIVERVLALGRRPQGVVYAVPGHPYVAEATCPEVARRARAEGLQVRVVEGLSFLEPAFTTLGLDPFPHTALVDALELALAHTPPFPPDVPALIAQIHSPMVAADVKLTLASLYPDEHPVKLLHALGTPQQVVEELALYEIDRSKLIGLLTVLYVPPLGPATSFEVFQEIIAHLRAPDGCPWDREQTHQSLRASLLEETYEALAALDADDPQGMCEEFGDLLLQVVLHAQIAAEYGEFTMADVLQGIHAKIVHRHPHVFGDLDLKDTRGVLLNWERLKEQERAANGKAQANLLDGVALALPALAQAEQYQHRAARVGFEWPDVQSVMGKLEEELEEVKAAGDDPARQAEIGDLLFAAVNLARWLQVEPESALREANARFRLRFAQIEAAARGQGRSVADLSLEEMLVYWRQSKRVD
ncbi:MAG: nucleoside triphosphate pyrophosphohydrolase [Anaerolineales bacterium]|nr:nucleoside triphosphate pyrophosphohydrolase [Anaerolineales bacterium]